MISKGRIRLYWIAALAVAALAFALSLTVGRYPIDWRALSDGGLDAKVFFTLRLPRTVMALVAGFALGIAGSVYQAVFQNPLASPDIIGVSSGASVGAAAAILAFGGGVTITALMAFLGGMAAVLAALTMSAFAGRRGLAGVVLSGIAVNALAQAVLMLLKLTADPERELAAVEFWMMGSFAGITPQKLAGVLPWVALGLLGMLVLRRQILLLGLEEDEALTLGVPVRRMRIAVLLLATVLTGAVVSVTGLIAFIGLLAPHIARLLLRSSYFSTTVFSGLVGGCLLLTADILARSLGTGEIPVSIVTSLLGAPFLFWLISRREVRHG